VIKANLEEKQMDFLVNFTKQGGEKTDLLGKRKKKQHITGPFSKQVGENESSQLTHHELQCTGRISRGKRTVIHELSQKKEKKRKRHGTKKGGGKKATGKTLRYSRIAPTLESMKYTGTRRTY